jgi:hypothetical protein
LGRAAGFRQRHRQRIMPTANVTAMAELHHAGPGSELAGPFSGQSEDDHRRFVSERRCRRAAAFDDLLRETRRR